MTNTEMVLNWVLATFILKKIVENVEVFKHLTLNKKVKVKTVNSQMNSSKAS